MPPTTPPTIAPMLVLLPPLLEVVSLPAHCITTGCCVTCEKAERGAGQGRLGAGLQGLQLQADGAMAVRRRYSEQ